MSRGRTLALIATAFVAGGVGSASAEGTALVAAAKSADHDVHDGG